MTKPGMSRRSLLTKSGALAGAAFLASLPGSFALASPAYADSPQAPGPAGASGSTTPTGEEIRTAFRRFERGEQRVRTRTASPNGWEMEKVIDGGGSIATRPVPGTPLTGVAVRTGDVETVLVHVIRRFHYEVGEVRTGEVTGWEGPGTVRKGRTEGNLASGTAVRIRPAFYPPGSRGGFFAPELTVIRDVLAELDGVVRWGGDDRHVDESLFSIDVKPGDPLLAEVAGRIRGWNLTPGQGAGTPVDVQAAERRRAARNLERRQVAAA
ncbi:hypothetical protein ACIQPQ_19885 [Streptomyces sp. NPDC091281]|uniref:hypothetical protein n=1 Tax=Streptomyces sp. NPDC091281 TaxID=3365985 RepID=UPI0037F5E200